MKKNMGIADRLIRLLLAVAITLLYVLDRISGTVAIIGLAIAAIFTITSLLGYCPLYSLIGYNGAKKNAHVGSREA